MDENFNPNRAKVDEYGAVPGIVHSGKPDTPRNHGAAVADVKSSLIAVLGNLGDGDVAVVGDLVAVRAGPATYHPIKAIKGMASDSDLILLSCLVKAPAAGDVTGAVQSVLQSVLVRTPSAMRDNPAGYARGAATGVASAAAAAANGPLPHLRSMCPSSHTAFVDARLLRGFPLSRARTVLAGLSPLPVGMSELPTIVAGIVGDGSGRCFLGQRAGTTGFSAFSLYLHDTEPEESILRIEDLIADCGPGTHASARALYDLSEASDGDVLGGCIRERANSMSFARLAMEWTYSSDTARTVGSQPPSGCPSLLLVGGACPPSAANATLRGDVEILANTIARNVASTARPTRSEGPRGPFLGGGQNGGVVRSANGDEDQANVQWEADIEALLSGSENLAELAARAAFRRGIGTGEGEGTGDQEGVEGRGSDDDTTGEPTETITFEVRLDEGETVGQRFRGDLDFSELLWELAARSSSAEGVRSTLSRAFHAVGEGHIFPVIRRENQTAIGRHIREGVALTREARYYNPMSMGDIRSSSTKRNEFGGPAGQQGEADAISWREQGAALLENVENLAEIFVELGVYKVTLDLYHWFEKRAGVLAADIERVLPSTTTDKVSADQPSTKSGPTEAKTLDPRLERLNILMMTRDLVTLAQSYETPWRQVRAVALSCLAKLSRRTRVGSSRGSSSTTRLPAYPPSSPPSTIVFPVALPKPIPAGARTKLAHPIFWELLLEPGEGGAYGGAETISYTVANVGLFQLKGADAASVFSAGAARAAQNALEKCPPSLVPEVLSCVAGAESFAELTRRQKVMRAKGDAAGDDKAATFVCKHRFMPW